MSPPLVILAAGGTGGHVFPAEALAEALQKRGCRLAFVTDKRGQNYGGVLSNLETHRLSLAPMRSGLVSRAKGMLALGWGIWEARRLLRKLQPRVVVGFGGYPSLPTVYAAANAGIATVIHEQNAILGRANRMLAPRARAIATSFPIVELLSRTEEQRQILTGNPVRPGVLAVREHGYTPAGANDPFNLLITGGSQGAGVFSRVVPAAIAGLPPSAQARIRVVQQARPEDIERLRGAYRDANIAAELATFFTDMPERLARAHLVIARAGASTIAELTTAGRPAILVPYPYATDDHQTANAFALATLGGAWTIADEDFSPATLTTHLASLMADPAPLARTAHEAMANGKPDAAERLADVVHRFAGANGNSNRKDVAQEEAA